MLDRLQSANFQTYVAQKFQVRLEGSEPIELELVSVTELGADREADMRRPFSLIFLGPPSNQYLLQGTYRLEHPQMGGLDLFIVPLGPQQQRMRYEVIFT
jgi:hypothetical protein